MNNKPNILISKCIEFDHCRYNGAIIRSEFVNELKPFVLFIPICPEVEIQLGIPRDPIRLIKNNNEIQLVQPSTKRNYTQQMNDFSETFLLNHKEIEGVILKSRSPSCGISDVKIYSSMKKGPAIEKSSGIFGGKAKELYHYLAIEDEKRLQNTRIKEHFLRYVFLLSRFKEVKQKKSINQLIDFHTKNKFLIMSYNQTNLKKLGRIVSNSKYQHIEDLITQYEFILYNAFKKAPSCTRNINVLQHIFGFFSKRITQDEKKYYLETQKAYRDGRTSLVSVTNILEAWAIRFNETYLLNQTFFKPYPKELSHIENIDSCNSRDYWKINRRGKI